jgi:hypothetical protein
VKYIGGGPIFLAFSLLGGFGFMRLSASLPTTMVHFYIEESNSSHLRTVNSKRTNTQIERPRITITLWV